MLAVRFAGILRGAVRWSLIQGPATCPDPIFTGLWSCPKILRSTCETAYLVYNTHFVMAESTETMDLKEFQLHEKDTGSADVQVALLTHRIAQLTEHLKTNAKDHSSRRGLLKMVAKRRSLLDYLSRSEGDRYRKLIDRLNLRK